LSEVGETAVGSEASVLRVNPALNPKEYADIFRRDGIVQIKNLLDPVQADRMATVIRENTNWQLTYSDEKQDCVVLNREDLAKVDLNRLWGEVIQRASQGFAYVYLSFPLRAAYGGPEHANHPLGHLVNFLNSPAFLDFAGEITGQPGVNRVDAAATWYRPGDFLTLHHDEVGVRRVAYTLGFTRSWRTDWGGQLLFHDMTGEIVRGLLPAFNVLTMFKIPRLHSVAQVAHYATEPRIVVSGWLLEDKRPA
jgi:SM-20-related protein